MGEKRKINGEQLNRGHAPIGAVSNKKLESRKFVYEIKKLSLNIPLGHGSFVLHRERIIVVTSNKVHNAVGLPSTKPRTGGM